MGRSGRRPTRGRLLAHRHSRRARAHPGFRFIAEAYWDLEWALQQQGFDFCYDKRLYDRLAAGEVGQIRPHLSADRQYQQRLVRFIENHDEPRAAAVFDDRRQRAAAVATLTQTGARLVHDGQFDGRKVRLPVFLGRYPDEPTDGELFAFYQTLLAALKDPVFRTGTWGLCECTGWPGNDTTANLVAWSWEGDSRWLVVVNLGDADASGHVRAPWSDLRGGTFTLTDPTTQRRLRAQRRRPRQRALRTTGALELASAPRPNHMTMSRHHKPGAQGDCCGS